MSSSARDVARRVLARVDRGAAWATPALDGELARSGLDERDRRLVSELVYGVLRHRSRLDRALGAFADLRRTPPAVLHALRIGAYQILFLRVPAHAAVDDAVAAVRGVAGGNKLTGFTNAVLRKLAAQGEPALPAEPRARLEVEHSLPAWIVDELVGALPADELAAAAAALTAAAPLWIRVNLARATRDEVAAALVEEGATAEPTPHAPGALRVTGLGDPGVSKSFGKGLWTVQDLGAQQIALLAAPAPGAKILDACAGVGGKSTHLAELAGAGAQVDAVDVAPQKVRLAGELAARLGVREVRAIHADLLDPEAKLDGGYQLVILDAPCSGLGVLRRHPEAKWRLGEVDVGRMAELQARLLDAVAARVAPGGVLVYSVCTFTVREGAAQVAAFLARHPDFAADGSTVTTWPHREGADAFYAVRMRRT